MENEVIRKIPNPYLKMIEWAIITGIVALIPISILAYLNRELYFATGTGFSNTIGLVMILVFVILILLKLSKFLKSIFGFWFLFGIFWFLRSIINDLVAISFCTALGYTLGYGFSIRFYYWKRKCRNRETATETAQANAQALGIVVDKIIRSGRG